MRDAPQPLPERVYRKLRGLTVGRALRRYRAMMRTDHPCFDFPMRIVGDTSEDPTETFDHCHAFPYGAAGVRYTMRSATAERYLRLELEQPR